ncbi:MULTISPECIES: IS630 family transposase [Rhizobium/Agrobacterium group]|uniref:IS630 family transposase n=1 Tax=Rhizobium/Agrobacterium group TaxID=227290 RepID=UPI0015736FA4|nr:MULTISPECIES: IS630 family transposase [Rhizobium/Agrobacterium group]NSX99706.1 IS630 family transposase [Agrobacterium vitis]NSZ30847.1 IS630 family transposase [Agrobacterium vitis]NSZ46313.1 IS630 family transposase [Agrobacterium vitis]NSZ56185.1 IS630 family transposase [Agrobacterium vitis]NTA35438.1 IS630 family transposase [Agrobacterium vitis]
MGQAIGLREDFDGASLRRLARLSKSAPQARRLLALAQIYEGSSRSEAARIGGVTLQIVRDWVIRFNARGPDGLLDGKAPGKPSILNDAQRRALVEAVERGPIPAIHGVVRWRLIDLVYLLHEEFAVSLDETTVSRELKKLGYVKLTARPRHHAQNELAMETFKKGFAAEVAKVRTSLPKGTSIEVWFQDEARVGQKNTITRRWARRGTRPSAPKDQRTKSAYIFGAICPEQGKGAGLILPFCNTETMSLHLAEIALAVAPGAHAVVLMDQAGWHMTDKLEVPDNISIIALPAKCPELNPVENVWQFMRDNWLSNRVFTSHDNILDHCCEAWNKLVDQPWRIMTIGRRKWARQF